MSTKLTNSERRRQERQRRRTLNIFIVAGGSLLIAAFILYLTLRPIDDLVEITSNNFPVPADGLTIGNPDALVLVEVFEDFQCPSCKQFSDDIKPRILQDFVFVGTARLQFRHNPFIGSDSTRAANAAMCANEQDRFWDYHDMLFANQLGENTGAFSGRRLEAMAELLGLDTETWSACYGAEDYEAAIQDDLDEARARGVTGTPTVFVNGLKLESADYGVIAAAIAAAAAAAP
jgi:protein-disulfide isomerase